MVAATPSNARVATAQQPSSGGSMFGNLFSSGGGESSGGVTDRVSRWWNGSSAPAEAPKAKAAPSKTAVATPRAKPAEAKQPAKQTANAGAIRPKQEPGQDANQQQANSSPPQSGGGNSGSLLNGAQPTVPGGFDGRFGAWR
jgi:hypothetical protein